MRTSKVYTTEIQSRGQLTIPKKIRDETHLTEGQTVSLIPLGEAILIAPRRRDIDKARRRIKRNIREKSGGSLDKLLNGLSRERAVLYREIYANRTR